MLKGRRISTLACQSGSGAEKAFEILRNLFGIDAFYDIAVFIAPKSKPSVKNDNKLEFFIRELSNE